MDQKMTHETEQALQTFSNIQIRNIIEMGADSSLSSKGLWDHYMAGLYGPLPRSATTIYANEKATFDTLSPIGRIANMQERLMPQLRAHRSTYHIAEASGPHLTTHSKRIPEADISGQQIGAQPMQKIQRLDMSSTGRQPRSDIHYWAIPTDMTPETCPDVGYQNDAQTKPYNYSLKQALLQENRCLACWRPGHPISMCPNLPPNEVMHMEHAQARGFQGRGPPRGGRYGRGRGPQRGYSGFRGRS